MGIVRTLHITHPGDVLGACTGRAVGLGPRGLAVHSRIAIALIIGTALAVTTATIGAVRRHSRDKRDQYQRKHRNLHLSEI